MAKYPSPGKLAVILHADVASSTELVQQDHELAHRRIRETFQTFGVTIEKFHGSVLEVRGDALLAAFEHASDAVSASLSFQAGNAIDRPATGEELRPSLRVGISIGEIVVADGTVTGAGVVQAQRVEGPLRQELTEAVGEEIYSHWLTVRRSLAAAVAAGPLAWIQSPDKLKLDWGRGNG